MANIVAEAEGNTTRLVALPSKESPYEVRHVSNPSSRIDKAQKAKESGLDGSSTALIDKENVVSIAVHAPPDVLSRGDA